VTTPTLGAPTAQTLAREHPEFRGWLDCLTAARDEASAQLWADAVPDVSAHAAPLLGGTTLAIDPTGVAAWLRRLFAVAATHAPALARADERLDPLAALEAAIALDTARMDALADGATLSREPLRAVLPLAAYPWLERCGERLAGRVPAEHAQAWCPICAAWVTLAEARGLEGARRLRCGRCGADWRAEWLRCAFCGTDEHARLRSLVAETTALSRRAEGCAACGAWVKTLTTLTAAPAAEVRLLDLATVELDVAALERGWTRPIGLGAPLDIRVVARAGDDGAAPPRRRWWTR
jgi:FdhE protein